MKNLFIAITLEAAWLMHTDRFPLTTRYEFVEVLCSIKMWEIKL